MTSNYLIGYLRNASRQFILAVAAVLLSTNRASASGYITPLDVKETPIGCAIIITTLLIIIVALIILRRQQLSLLRKVQHKNNQLNMALDCSSMGMWEWDLLRDRFFTDSRCVRRLGYIPDENTLHIDWWIAKIHPDDRPRYQEVVDSLKSGSVENIRCEYRVKTKSGDWRWILDRGRVSTSTRKGIPINAIGTRVDVSERHHTENKLIRMATLIKQASETIMVTNKEGLIEYVNPAFEQLLGYSSADVIGQHPRILHDEEASKGLRKIINDELQRNNIWHGVLSYKCKNGSTIKLKTTISPIKNNQGEIIQYMAIGHDITHEELLEMQLRQAQKLQAIGTLAGGIAHDFNNILSAILGYSELAMLDTQSGTTAHHNMQEVFKGAKRAADLVAHILAFSRRTEQERRPLLLAPIIKEALKLLRGSLPSTIDIRQNIAKDCPPVLADPTQMHQVIMNLCTNAFHAMREKGGTLEVTLDTIDISNKQQIGEILLQPGTYVRMTVADTGCGMTDEIRERIFEPYFTTRKGGDGTGLGLATTHGIIQFHNGAISVKSKPEQGSVFTVYLPACQPELNQDSDTAKATALPRGNGELIMVVDDEEAIAQVIEITLRHIGYDVEAFTSSVKALEAFEAAPQQYDCIITDQTMPTLTGVEFAKRVLKLRPGLPIILCSGFSEHINAEKSAKIGIAKYLMKPTTSRVIAESVHTVLNDTR